MTQQNTSAPAPKKAKKKKGPIRWEAIAPFTIFVLLVWAYFFFFFDNHLRRALEYVGTQANGAEVNIGDIRTSFWGASLEIDKIQLTNADEPAKNKIQIGQMRWKMLWDALLRGKIAIEDASILEVAIGVPRARPGRVLPPPPPGEGPSATDKLKAQAMEKVQEEFSKNVLGDVAAILGGVDPSEQLKNIEGQLKSSTEIKRLQEELTKKQAEWKARLERLPKQQDIQAIDQRIKSVKVDRFNNPLEVQQSIQQIDAIIKDVNAKVNEVQDTSKALNGDVNTYQNTFKELDQMVKNDIKDLENRLKIPKLDVASMSKSIFGPMVLGRVRDVQSYMDKAREYMPPKKSKEEKAEFKPPTPHERAEGRNYKFGRPNSYPLFWLKQAKISSKATPGAEYSGNLEGALKDVTDDPPIIGRPTIASFKGDFPGQHVFGVDGKITIDHVTEKPVESLDIKVASVLVANRLLVNSPDVKLGIDGADASTGFEAVLSGGELKIKSSSTFQKRRGANAAQVPNPAPGAAPVPAAGQPPLKEATPTPGAPPSGAFLTAQAQQPILDGILKSALADIPRVTLNAGVQGSWTNLRFDLDSNLGGELARAFDKQIQVKIAEARAKLENFVNEQIGKEKAKLEGEFAKVKGQVDQVLKEKQAEIDKIKKQVEDQKNQAIKNQKGNLENEAKKGLDDLKKKFKF
jgi:uncharacterized protein (TIGR03545 family)